MALDPSNPAQLHSQSLLVNGRRSRAVSALSRGLAYGDGVFETLLWRAGEALWLEDHLQRLASGCRLLGLETDLIAIEDDVAQLGRTIDSAGVIKIVVARRAGGRGYTPSHSHSDRVVASFPAPGGDNYWQHGVRIDLCQQRLSPQPTLAGIKHLNRLEQVLAARELNERSLPEGLMLDTTSAVVEGTRSNLFIVRDGRLYTPDLANCGVAGIMRQRLLASCDNSGVVATLRRLSVAEVLAADEVFLCNSVFGIWPVTAIGCVHKPIGALTRQFQQQFSDVFHA
ncbi:aminodeoxychorismate lyase [Spongiibacter nanhainus]|uniref:Aminodeoxychorismate lyase n=1 Tax=Spongiibacter nanhainus TaxID=2794344 RepID=A0A7T4R419_9GAMM|nr:aminodeoxychorismate lyase [Spongiibacter nanhainus]QQD19879.1 aminodeoxychorismate lyase [Spongiibacter nanhainus]